MHLSMLCAVVTPASDATKIILVCHGYGTIVPTTADDEHYIGF